MASSTVTLLNLISSQIYIYVGIPTVILGVLGGILNMIVFLSLRIFRKNSSGIYLIMMSLVNIGQLIFGDLYRIVVYTSLIPSISISVFSCTIRIYFVQIFAFISMSYICLAIIDQYMATSKYTRLQQWSKPKIAYYLCGIVSLFWILYCSPHLIYYKPIFSATTNTTVCIFTNNIYQNYVSRFYTPVLLNTLPAIVMIISGLLAYRNVRQLSYRTVPLVRRQHETQITKIVLTQALVSVLLISPYFILVTVINNIQLPNDPIIIAQIQLALSILICIYYIYYAVPFYIYICVSQRYRQQLFYVLFQIYFQKCCKNNQIIPRV